MPVVWTHYTKVLHILEHVAFWNWELWETFFFNIEHTFHDLETKDYADDGVFYKLNKIGNYNRISCRPDTDMLALDILLS